MWKRIIESIVVLLITLGCFSCAPDDQKRLETEFCQCIYNRFDSLGIDLERELYQYEQFLVETGYLADSTGIGHKKVFEYIAANHEVPESKSYSIPGLSKSTIPFFNECHGTLKTDRDFRKRKERKVELYMSIERVIDYLRDDLYGVFATAYLEARNTKDFDAEFHRMYALYIFYFINNYERIPDEWPASSEDVR